MLLVHHRQLRSGQLRISLRRREPFVPQQFLNRAQVRAFLQQVSSKCMAQRVRMHVRRKPAQNRDPLHDAAHAARRQPRLPAGCPTRAVAD